MTHKQREFLYRRPPQDGHSTVIPSQKENADDAYDELLADVFALQPIPFPGLGPPPNKRRTAALNATVPSSHDIAGHFYAQNYVPTVLARGHDGKSTISESAFIDHVILHACGETTNRLFFLLGPVGSGKTTFINHLIAKHGPDWFSNNALWYLKVDLWAAARGDTIDYVTLVDMIIDKLLEVMKLPSDPLELRDKVGDFENTLRGGYSAKDKEARIQEFVLRYRSNTGRQLFLVLDNLDYIYHRHDLQSFFPNGKDLFQQVAGAVAYFVSSFIPDSSPLSHLGANILFVVRWETHAVLRVSREHMRPAVQLDQHTYELRRPAWNAVLQERGNLLKWAIDQIQLPGRKKDMDTRAAPVIEDIFDAGAHRLLDNLEHITNYGLRDLMEFFQRYSWLEGRALRNGNSQEGLRRLVEHYPVGLIAFMLNDNCLYSQNNSPVPNVFLTDNRAPEIVHLELRHSYWLKYLLLQYIRSKREDELPEADEIEELFTAGKSGYPIELIRACLGSLSMAGASNFIEVLRAPVRDDRVVAITDIRLSERGRFFLDTLVGRFFYLQLIVDDWMLPLPRCVRDVFDYKTLPCNYSYLVAPSDAYTAYAHEMIKVKAEQVRLLLIVLDEALECERIVFDKVFETLARCGVEIPNTKAMIESLDKELGVMTQFITGILDVQALQGRTDCLRETIRRQLEDAYTSGDNHT